jgi:hypothetical protein
MDIRRGETFAPLAAVAGTRLPSKSNLRLGVLESKGEISNHGPAGTLQVAAGAEGIATAFAGASKKHPARSSHRLAREQTLAARLKYRLRRPKQEADHCAPDFPRCVPY